MSRTVNKLKDLAARLTGGQISASEIPADTIDGVIAYMDSHMLCVNYATSSGSARGLILTSPNGTEYTVYVGDDGVLTTTLPDIPE